MTSDAAPFTVGRETRGGSAVLVLVGELDPASGPLLDDAVDEAVNDGAQELIVDMAGLTFIDSSGLRSLITAHKRFAPDAVVLRGPTSFARQVLSITGLDQHFRIEPDNVDPS